jgi:hypothetical protein
MAANRFVEVIDEEKSEIKINSVPKNTACVKILKQLFASGSVIIGDYHATTSSRLGDYNNTTSSRRILPDNHRA